MEEQKTPERMQRAQKNKKQCKNFVYFALACLIARSTGHKIITEARLPRSQKDFKGKQQAKVENTLISIDYIEKLNEFLSSYYSSILIKGFKRCFPKKSIQFSVKWGFCWVKEDSADLIHIFRRQEARFHHKTVLFPSHGTLWILIWLMIKLNVYPNSNLRISGANSALFPLWKTTFSVLKESSSCCFTNSPQDLQRPPRKGMKVSGKIEFF